MSLRRSGRPSRQAAITVCVAVVALLTGSGPVSGMPAGAGSAGPVDRTEVRHVAPRLGQTARVASGHQPGNVDSRSVPTRALHRTQAAVLRQHGDSIRQLGESLGSEGLLAVDPLTGTPDNLSRLDGFLSPPSSATPVSVALGYVRANLGTLGLTGADLSTLRLRSQVEDMHGITHLSWVQEVGGVPVFGNGLRAHVTRDGSLISLQGAPVPQLAGLASDAPSRSLDASEARDRAISEVGGSTVAASIETGPAEGGVTAWSNGDRAAPVWFLTAGGLRAAWSTYTVPNPGQAYQSVIDATTGRVLYRRSTVEHEHGDALVHDNYPGSSVGGEQHRVDLIARGWIPGKATWLRGANVFAWADLDDDDVLDANEKTPVPGTKKGAQFRFKPQQDVSTLCTTRFLCSWDPETPFSWRTNKNHDVTQAFYFANVFHDYLKKAPIGFTPQMGNFEDNGGDPLLLHALNGAATDNGLPDADHVDETSMNTPPDSVPPTMQLELFHEPGTTANEDPYLPASAANEADTVFHEYTHGMSNRLVVDAAGNSTLLSLQARAMGEGWSDYYAMDYLVTKGLVTDTATSGQVLVGKYVSRNLPISRREAIDCAVGSRGRLCVKFDGSAGGYTFGDLGAATGGPEVHADGEIWGQTLWDLRAAVGHRVTAALVTEAMSLSTSDPTFLDERDAIVAADRAIYGGRYAPAIWKVFAARGMGFFASTSGATDADVIEDFSLPPDPTTPRATVLGTITDDVTEQPLAGVSVFVGGHFTQWSDVTDASGRYRIDFVTAGHYPEIVAQLPGYDLGSAEATVAAPSTQVDFALRRDWASQVGGGMIDRFTGPDFGAGCGPDDAIDQVNSEGWSTDVADGDPSSKVDPKYVVVRLPEPVDITSFAIDPSNTCGDGTTAAMRAYTIEVSLDGEEFSPVADGTFAPADLGKLNEIPLDDSLPGVQYVKLWINDNMLSSTVDCEGGGAFAFSGCRFMDLTEFEVYGRAGPPESTDLQLLSFNDFHGHLEATDPPLSAQLDPTRTPVGGVEYLATAVKDLRAQQPDTTLTVAAGDLIGGSTFLSGLFQDQPSIEAMEELGLDVSSVGNHEFDEGTDELLRMVEGGCQDSGCFQDQNGDDIEYDGADFDYLAANVVNASDGAPFLPGPVNAVKDVDGIPVGFIGMTLEATPTLVNPAGVSSVDFLDEIETAEKQAAALKAGGVETIIVLLHEGGLQSGTYNDCAGPSGAIMDIAEQITPEVDMLVTGHTHQPYVCTIDDSAGNPRFVTSAASFGQVLTETHLIIDRATREVIRPESTSANHLVVRTVPPDPGETSIVDFWKALSEPLAAQVVGTLEAGTDITGDASTCRCEETPMVDLVADAILEGTQAPADGGAEIALMNTGGVRASLRYDAINNGEDPGEITYAESYNVAPFNNILVTLDLTGAQIEAVLNQQFQRVSARGSRPMLSLGVSAGFSYEWAWDGDVPAPNTQPGVGTTGGHVVPGSMQLDGVPIEPGQTYRVATLNFLAEGGDLFTGFAAGTNRLGGPEDLPNLVDYFGAHPGLTPPADRITGL
jgi:extracellular elastinolytic metalloproteinase